MFLSNQYFYIIILFNNKVVLIAHVKQLLPINNYRYLHYTGFAFNSNFTND